MFWTDSYSNLKNSCYAATYLPSHKSPKKCEPDTGQLRINSLITFIYRIQHMEKLLLVDQQKLPLGMLLQDLPRAMADRERWRKNQKNLCYQRALMEEKQYQHFLVRKFNSLHLNRVQRRTEVTEFQCELIVGMKPSFVNIIC